MVPRAQREQLEQVGLDFRPAIPERQHPQQQTVRAAGGVLRVTIAVLPRSHSRFFRGPVEARGRSFRPIGVTRNRRLGLPPRRAVASPIDDCTNPLSSSGPAPRRSRPSRPADPWPLDLTLHRHGVGAIPQRAHRQQCELFELSQAFTLHRRIRTTFSSLLLIIQASQIGYPCGLRQLLLVLLAMAAACGGGSGPAPTPTPTPNTPTPPATWSLSGTVTETLTGTPVGGAALAFSNLESVTADSSGHWMLRRSDTPDSSLLVELKAAGYWTAASTSRGTAPGAAICPST